ncbi:hypothetical protein K7862_36460, partial [Streptomyces sp. PLK6-54]|nr:hypothetical protein [Streptomyces acidipaludis]
MARPGDWSPLGLHGDPTPGDLDVLQSIHDQMDDLGTLAREVTSGLDRVLNQSTDSFIGKTAEAVRKKIDGHLKKFIDSVGDSFGVSAPATADYINAIRDAQAKADQALSGAQGLAKDDPKLDALKSQVNDARDAYDRASRTYVSKLSDASHMIQQPISGWQLFLQALGILAIILAVLGAIFGGWVGLIAMAVNVALLIKTAVEFAEGKASMLDLVLAVIGVLFPSTKGLNVGSIGKGIFNALKNLPKTAMTGLSNVGRGLLHIVLNPGSLNVFRNVAALPGLVIRGLTVLGNFAFDAGKLAIGGLKAFGGAFKNDFALATFGVKGALPNIGVYAFSVGSRFVVSATLPLDFFELGVGARAAIKMGLGTRLSTPWAHLSQPIVSGGAHVGALAGGHFGLHAAGNATGFDPAHGSFGNLSGGSPGLHGSLGATPGLGALHGLTSVSGISGLHGLNTLGATHLGGGLTPSSLNHAVGNLGSGASAVDHLTAIDHASGFDRTAHGLLEPSAVHFSTFDNGAVNLGAINPGSLHAASGAPHLGISSLHTGRADMTVSGAGLHGAISDSMSGVRAATGHVADFHALGIPELRSIVDGDVNVVRMTPDGITMHVGAEAGPPTALHMNFRTMSLTNDAGHQVGIAPEVHGILGTGDGHVGSRHLAPPEAQVKDAAPMVNSAGPSGVHTPAANTPVTKVGGTGPEAGKFTGAGSHLGPDV